MTGTAAKPASGRRLRVLQVIAGVGMGGLENQTAAFLERYDRRRFAMDVCCAQSTEGPLRDRFLATGARLHLCRWSPLVFPFVFRVYRLLRRQRYDVVHARAAELSGAVILAARMAGVPVRIASYHHTKIRDTSARLRSLAIRFLQRMTRKYSTNILGISEATLEAYFPDWRRHPELFEVCHNGIDPARFQQRVDPAEVRGELGIPPQAAVVGNVGSFREAKGHRVFVQAAVEIARRRPDAWFLLVGDGALRPQVEAEVDRLGMKQRFVFAGVRQDIPRMLAAMDVFLMPSQHEGFGTVAVEAQAAGVPVVASDLASIREGLCPQLHPFCRDPQDAPGFAGAVTRLLKAPVRRAQLGRSGRRYVLERFSIERTADQLQRIYGGCPECRR